MQAKVCDRTRQPVVYRTLAKTSDEWLSWIYSILLQIDRLQLTAVYCNRRGVKTTPQLTRFRDAKVCNNWLQIRIDDHRIQSDYKYKSELQNPEGKKSVLGIDVCVVKPSTTPMTTWPSRLRGETEHDTNDNVTTKTQNTFNTAHMNTDTWVRSSLVC